MIRSLIPILLVAVAMPAAEGHAKTHAKAHQDLGTVIGRQVVDAGHVLEVRSLANGQYLIRWGDVDNAITGKAGKGSAFTWDGGVSASSGTLAFVRTVAFEDGHAAKAGKEGSSAHGDRVTADGYGGQVSWKARTTGAWDGVVVQASGHGSLSVSAGSATLNVAMP